MRQADDCTEKHSPQGVVGPFVTWGYEATQVKKKKCEAKLENPTSQARRSYAKFSDPTQHAETSKAQKESVYFKMNLLQITFSFAYPS